MEVGLLKTGDPADFIVVKDLENFQVEATYIDGTKVAGNGKSNIITSPSELINNFNCHIKKTKDFFVKRNNDDEKMAAIEALDGQLITNKILVDPKVENGGYVSDSENDILKIAVVNRYKDAPIAIGFVKNFGLKKGAIASSVAHDSHNIIVLGADDESICRAVNLIIENRGGISCVDNDSIEKVLPLPVAGLMSNDDGFNVADNYSDIDRMAKSFGSQLSAPFMTLSFMALLVIPHVKLSDLGLFDGDAFKLI
jgi:adenine deaminase